VVISDQLWLTEFARDRTVLGRSLVFDEVLHEVVGVLPTEIEDVDAWVPLQISRATATRSNHWVRVLARLAPGTTSDAAHTEMVRIAAELEAEVPDNRNRGAFVEPLGVFLRGNVTRTLIVLLGAVFVLLLIACVNVANLLLARGTTRAREVAVHTAMGAGIGRLARKFAVEGMMIAGSSALLGSVIAVAGVRVLMSFAPAEVGAFGTVDLSLPVFTFGIALSVAIGVGFGILPTLQARRLDLVNNLKEGDARGGSGATKMGVRRVLIASQMAMAFVLLVSAGLMIGTLRNLSRVDAGFDADKLVRMTFQLPNSRYPQDFATYPDWPEVNAFLGESVRVVEALPGVVSAAHTINHPLHEGWTNSFGIEGRESDPERGEMSTRLVSPGYLKTVGMRLIEGRFIEESDGLGTPLVLVLNRTAAERYFPDGDAIGSRITFWGPNRWREVIGIVEDEKIHGLVAESPPAQYANILQTPPLGAPSTLMVHTALDPTAMIGSIQEAIWGIDQSVPIFDVAKMSETRDTSIGRERFTSMVLSVFSLLAVFLSLLGVHGVLSYQVAQRRREVGVRMALGASRQDVLAMVLRQGMTMALFGLGAGVVVALGSSRLLGSLLYGIAPNHPLTFVAVFAGLASAALVGSFLPARKATRIDPMNSLRGD